MKPAHILPSAVVAATALAQPLTAMAAEPDGHGTPSLREVFALDNYELWGPVVNFLLFLFLIVFFGGPRIQRAMAERRNRVARDLDEAQQLRAEAQAKHDEYTRRLEQLDQEMARLRQEMIHAGEAERDRIVGEAEAKASRMRKETQFVIEQQLKQLREDLTREAVEAAVSSAEQVLRDKITASDQQRLAQEYLGTLEGHAGSQGAARSTGGSTSGSSGQTAAAKGGEA